jgi:hypothetical protein
MEGIEAAESGGSTDPGEHRKAPWLLAILAASTALRLTLAWLYVGFITGDDVEILEAGLSPITDLDYPPWVIRNLLVPRLLVTPVAWLATGLGGSDPTLLVRLAALPFIALSTLNVYLVYLVARRGLSEGLGLLAAGIYACHWLVLGFGATVYPRTVATTCVLMAFYLLLGRKSGLVWSLAAGLFMAFAFAARYSEVIYLAPLGLMSWALGLGTRRALVRGAALGGGFVLGSLLSVGVVDLWTWGEPFQSLVEFARYTLVEKQASALRPDQPPLWYLSRVQFWLIPTLVPFLAVRKRGEGIGAFWLMFLLPILALSFIHHKDVRYLQGVIPFLALLVAGGVHRFWARGWRKTTVALLIVSGLFSLRTALELHREKSLSAVRAALELREEPGVDSIVVTQAWAYGDRLFLGPDMKVANFETSPSPEELREVILRADAAAFYEDDLRHQAALREELGRAGFEEADSYRIAASRSVVVFRKRGRATSEGRGGAHNPTQAPPPGSTAHSKPESTTKVIGGIAGPWTRPPDRAAPRDPA